MANRGVNKVILVGNVGRDPEARFTKDNVTVVNLSLATTDVWFDQQTNEQQERTEWHRVVFFGKLADVVKDHVSRGKQLYVEGRLQTRKWEDQRTGVERYTTEVIGSEMLLLSGRDSSGYSDRSNRDDGAPRGRSSAPTSHRSTRSDYPAKQATDLDDDLDDDLPW